MDTDTADRLAALERRFEALLSRAEQLALEHRALKARAQQLAQERARLAEQTAAARSRVETMIERLRALERGT